MENPCGSQGQCLQTQPGLEPGLPPWPAPSGLSQRLALHRGPPRHPRAALGACGCKTSQSWRVRHYGVQLAHFIISRLKPREGQGLALGGIKSLAEPGMASRALCPRES